MPKKTILLINHEGHQYDPEYGTYWSDTWVEFELKRKKIRIGPTLVSTTALDREREIFGAPGKHEWYEEPVLPEGDWEFCFPYKDDEARDDGIPHIAINGPWVTKALIEKATEWYIRGRYGVTAPLRFRWKANRDQLFFIPS